MPINLDRDTALNRLAYKMSPRLARGRIIVFIGAILAVAVVWSSIAGLLLRERDLVIAAEERTL